MSWSPPGIFNPNVGVITPWSAESIGPGLMSTTTTTALAAGNWPSANLAIYVPFEVASTVTVTAAFYYSSGNTGNIDCGVYSLAGARLASSGTTASAAVWTVVDLSDLLLQPGRYYMAFARSATSGATTFRAAPATPIDAALGVKQQASALPLPATATFSDASFGYIPAIGLQLTTVNL